MNEQMRAIEREKIESDLNELEAIRLFLDGNGLNSEEALCAIRRAEMEIEIAEGILQADLDELNETCPCGGTKRFD